MRRFVFIKSGESSTAFVRIRISVFGSSISVDDAQILGLASQVVVEQPDVLSLETYKYRLPKHGFSRHRLKLHHPPNLVMAYGSFSTTAGVNPVNSTVSPPMEIPRLDNTLGAWLVGTFISFL